MSGRPDKPSSYPVRMKPRIRDSFRWPAVLRSLAVCLLIALVPAACTAPAGSEPEASSAAGQVETEPAAAPATAGGGPVRRGQSLAGSEDLIGLGELGLLPSLIQSLGAGLDCDFDDALSTCQ